MSPKISFFASAIRPHLWEDLLNSLKGSKYEYEVIFAGHVDQGLVKEMFSQYKEFKYITTGEIKPAQCYEIARRSCIGDLVCWIADDCTFSDGFVDKIYDYSQLIKQEWLKECYLKNIEAKGYFKGIISCKTNENNQIETMQNHRFFGRNLNTPLMAPIGVMVRKHLDLLGGLDKRYICGQYENDIVMRNIVDGGKVYLYEDVYVNIDHANKHGKNNNFWSGYNEDREQLENSWCVGGYQEEPKSLVVLTGKHGESPYIYFPIKNVEVTLKRNDEFQPYSENISLTQSEGASGIWK